MAMADKSLFLLDLEVASVSGSDRIPAAILPFKPVYKRMQLRTYLSLANSLRAALRIGTSGSASFQRAKNR